MPRKLSPDKLVQRLLQGTPSPVYLLDPQGRIVFVNDACAAWLGEAAEVLLGRRCEYHAAGDLQTEAIPSLAPPPDLAAGESVSGYVAGSADGGKLRVCHFQSLRTDDDAAGAYILAVVSAGPVSTLSDNAPSNIPSDARYLHAQLLELRAVWKRQHKSAPFLGVSPASERIRSQIRLAATGTRRVLIIGPRGSGREHVARSIHLSQAGPTGPLVPIACRLLDAELLQQTLAAYLKRYPPAKTSNAALLLQDVDRLSAGAQHELAEFLRLPGVELTLRATARRSLHRLVRQGRFRADLAQALSTLTIVVPALRNRPEDIPLLAQHFVEQENASQGRKFSGFSVDALDALAAYRWPGNVKELQQMVRESCSRAPGPFVTPPDLPDRLRHEQLATARPARAPEKIDLDDLLAGIEREVLGRALAAAKGNKTRAATLLGIHRARLIRRLVQLGLAEAPSVREADEREDEVVIFEPHPDEA